VGHRRNSTEEVAEGGEYAEGETGIAVRNRGKKISKEKIPRGKEKSSESVGGGGGEGGGRGGEGERGGMVRGVGGGGGGRWGGGGGGEGALTWGWTPRPPASKGKSAKPWIGADEPIFSHTKTEKDRGLCSLRATRRSKMLNKKASGGDRAEPGTLRKKHTNRTAHPKLIGGELSKKQTTKRAGGPTSDSARSNFPKKEKKRRRAF